MDLVRTVGLRCDPMKIRIVVVGRNRGPISESIREFEARVAHYWKLEVVEVDSGIGRGGTHDESEVRRAEAERLRNRLPREGEVWALTRTGDELGSSDLAARLGKLAVSGSAGVTFLIGGAFGLDDSLLKPPHRTLSLSRMTLPHAIARLFLVEQLYRAGTILRNEPYHKGGGT